MKARANYSRRTIASLAFLLVVLLPICCRAQTAADAKSADFYVATNGRDDWSGRVADANADHTDGPFATLIRARNAVRALKRVSDKKDFVVSIRGGTYLLRETLVFSLEDSAPNGGTITYVAAPHETPILSSGVPIRGWRELREKLPGLPAVARGKVWVADLPPGIDRLLSLYDREERLPRARTKGFTPPEFVKPNQPLNQFRFPAGTVRNWPDLKEAELLVIPSCDYEMNILPIAAVDEQAGVAKTALSPSRPIGRVKYFDKTLWIENILEALDEPGEWVSSAAQRKIYFWPKGDRPGDGIVAPTLTELVKIEGHIDYDGPRDQPVRGLAFHGLTFEHAERFPWHGYTGWSLQHSWEIFDRPTAAVRFRGAAECAVEGCRFTATSGTGIRLDLTCQKNRIVGNEFAHVGAMAILLAGYGPGTKNSNDHNEVVNNLVHHTGEVYWATPAIMVWQSGNNHVAHNLIHHTPYTGIAVNGRVSMGRNDPSGDASRAVRWREIGDTKLTFDWSEWYDYEKFLHARKNLVEKNDIHHVMESMGDGNGIYISGCGRANHIYQNFVHGCTGTHMGAGIRCDDVQNETIVEGNVIFRINSVQVGVSMTGRNHILNNIIADIRPSPRKMRPANIVHGYICLPGLYPYGPKNARLDLSGARIERNIVYSPRKDYLPVLEYRSFSTGPGERLKGTHTDHNLYWCPRDPTWGERYLDAENLLGVETESLCADPKFVDIENGDLRLKSDSPAWKLGFQKIDFAEIGLLPNHPYDARAAAKFGHSP
jgi:Right handed beta helix region